MSDRLTLVHWFRKGLRVHDNPALVKIFQKAHENPEKYCVRPIFILDPEIIQWLRVGANRWRFLQQSLDDLHKQLVALNSRLYVVRGNPTKVFPRLFEEWQTKLLTFEEDIEPYALKRDEGIKKMARESKVEVETFWSHTLYNPYVVIQKNMGKPPLTYQKFLGLVEKIKVPEPEEVPKKLSNSLPCKDNWEELNDNCYDVPLLEDLVKNMQDLGPEKFPGGETEALQRLETSLTDGSWVAAFEKPQTSPNSLEPSTTVLSPYLKFGCLSSRLFYKKLTEVFKKHTKHSKPPVSLMGQLYWREMYYTAATAEPNFDRMIGNSICLQIPWESNETHLKAWTYGRTGYPFIDAIMRQLRQEGWIHHLARHAVACFLTRGDLWISWEEGQKVFEELLLDQDWALNAGNWMWLSASAFFHQYFRVYSPVAFGKKTDPTGLYIRKYVPELAKYPAGAIYEPWKVSAAEQRKYGCVVGQDYPHRIVNHEVVHKENIKRMSAAYKVNREVKTGKEDQTSSKRKRESKVERSQLAVKKKKSS